MRHRQKSDSARPLHAYVCDPSWIRIGPRIFRARLVNGHRCWPTSRICCRSFIRGATFGAPHRRLPQASIHEHELLQSQLGWRTNEQTDEKKMTDCMMTGVARRLKLSTSARTPASRLGCRRAWAEVANDRRRARAKLARQPISPARKSRFVLGKHELAAD